MVTCPFCCLHCDDLRVDLRGGHLSGVFPSCEKATTGYTQALINITADVKPEFKDLVSCLLNTRHPFVVLSEAADQETAEAAIKLTKDSSGTLIPWDYRVGGELAASMARAGLLLGTLGELKKSADSIVVCGPDPMQNAPRIWEHLGEEKRRITLAELGADPIYVLRWLRLALRKQPTTITEQIRLTGEAISASRNGVFLIDQEWLSAWHNLAAELLLYLQELNQTRRWYALYHSAAANPTGIDEGSLGNARPAFQALSPCSAAAGADFILFTGRIPPWWAAHPHAWSGKPAFCLSPCPPGMQTVTWIPVAQPGVDGHGSMLRLDGIPVALVPLLPGTRLSAAQVLDSIRQEAAA